LIRSSVIAVGGDDALIGTGDDEVHGDCATVR
jgi:hypothetical protein